MKQELTNREKCCVVYGYVRRMAEESKENGLFNDLTIDEIARLFLHANWRE